MIKIKYIFFTIILLSSLTFSIFALDNSNASFKALLSMEKLTFENNEPILLYINVKNKSGIKKTFKVYDDYITFRPVIYDMNGREAETLVAYRLQDKSISETVKEKYPRSVDLSNNEIFTYIVDLKKLYRIDPDKEYRVKAIFSPEADDSELIISDNQLNFKNLENISNARNSGIFRIKRFSSPERALTPSEVVLLLIKAEKDRDWDNYFKFINIEMLINAYPDYVKIYNNAVRKNDIEQKEKIILAFVNFLRSERSDYIISYKIERELKRTENNIYVEALIKRFASMNPSVYKYRYSLERYENLWLITDVEVTVAKGQNI